MKHERRKPRLIRSIHGPAVGTLAIVFFPCRDAATHRASLLRRGVGGSCIPRGLDSDGDGGASGGGGGGGRPLCEVVTAEPVQLVERLRRERGAQKRGAWKWLVWDRAAVRVSAFDVKNSTLSCPLAERQRRLRSNTLSTEETISSAH